MSTLFDSVPRRSVGPTLVEGHIPAAMAVESSSPLGGPARSPSGEVDLSGFECQVFVREFSLGDPTQRSEYEKIKTKAVRDAAGLVGSRPEYMLQIMWEDRFLPPKAPNYVIAICWSEYTKQSGGGPDAGHE